MFDLTKVNWNRLYYFYVVGQTQSITVAARQVNLDQSAMSRQIIALEKELGLELLFRGRVGISLTEVGESVYKMACKIIELSLEENQNIDNIRNEISGTLRVLTTQTVMRNCTDYLPQFYKKFPRLTEAKISKKEFFGIAILLNYFFSLSRAVCILLP